MPRSKRITRSAARELAFCCIYEASFGATDAVEIVLDRTGEGFASLLGEDELFGAELQEREAEYVKNVVSTCLGERESLEKEIARLSVGWDMKRITRVTKSILLLALTEILYIGDVPAATAVNEAVELAKKYDVEKAPGFVNGILGSYLRGSETETKDENGG